jgi:hypothetical protein
MVHIDPDFKTKKEFLEALKNGREIYIFSPGPFPAPKNGRVTIEAPAEYHKWYCQVEIKDGRVIRVIK